MNTVPAPLSTPPLARLGARLRAVPVSAWPYLAFLVLFVVGGIIRPSLFSLDALWSTAGFAMILAIVSSGQTLAVISGGIDLSVPNTLTISALAYLTAVPWAGAVGALFVAIAIGIAIGLFNGVGISSLGINPIVMTIATNGLVFGILLLQFDLAQLANTPQLLTSITSAKVELLGMRIPAVVPLGLGLLLALQALLLGTGFGRIVYLLGSSPESARLAGVPVWQARIAVYALAGALAAFGGVVVAGYFNQVSVGMGDAYLLASVAAVVVGGASIFGGTGSMLGTLGGALVLSQTSTLVAIADLGVSTQQILYGLIILAVVAVYGRERRR